MMKLNDYQSFICDKILLLESGYHGIINNVLQLSTSWKLEYLVDLDMQ